MNRFTYIIYCFILLAGLPNEVSAQNSNSEEPILEWVDSLHQDSQEVLYPDEEFYREQFIDSTKRHALDSNTTVGQIAFDKKLWSKKSKALKYPEGHIEEEEPAIDPPDIPLPEDKRPLPSWYADVGQIVVIVFGTLIFLLIAYQLFGKEYLARKNRHLKGDVTSSQLENIEENLPEAEIDRFLAQAIKNEQWSVAIRLYFLITIQNLDRQKLIKWKRDKTNRIYQQEVRHQPFAKNFTQVVRLYEQVWYGEIAIDAENFAQAEKVYLQLLDQIYRLTSTDTGQ